MRRFFKGTRRRLTLTTVAILAGALLLADGGLFAFLTVTEVSASDAVLVSQARVLSASLEDVNGRPALDATDIPGETATGIAVDAAVVVDGLVSAHTVAQPLPAARLAGIAQAALRTGGPAWADMVDVRGVHRRVYAVPIGLVGTPRAALVVSRSVDELRGNLSRFGLFGLVATALLVTLVGGLTYWMTGRALSPVRRIAGLARSISEHDLHRRVEAPGPSDELGELVSTFNSMLARLEASFDTLGRFTADASHELRAPLSVMRAEIEGALTRDRSSQEYKRLLRSLGADVEHLGRLADQLLMLARADGGALQPDREPIDLVDLLEETAARWRPHAGRAGVRVRVEPPASGTLSADPRLLRRVFDNLLDNAIRHTPAQGQVTIRAVPAGEGWDLDVADEGPGVPPELRAHLFERFAKSDRARTPAGGGAGLGLALSAAIARAHGGRLSLASDGGPGAVFRLHLPADPI